LSIRIRIWIGKEKGFYWRTWGCWVNHSTTRKFWI